MTKISKIEEIIEDAKNGKMFLLVDSEDRENEGDLIIPAQKSTPEAISFMAKHGRGLICLCLTEDRVKKLKLPLMNPNNWGKKTTAFTVSIEASKNITTGISAFERNTTVHAAINSNFKDGDISSPGHMFPLIGWDGGVLTRAGHTEAAIDISRLANLDLSAVICEVMKDDGHMARLPDLMTFAEEHNLRIGTIRDLIAYRINHDLVVKEISVNSEFWLSNPITEGFILTLFENSLDGSKHATLHLGNLEKDKSILTRVHPIQSFDDIIFNLDNPKTKDLKSSLEKIKKNGSGMVVLINNPILQGMSNLNLDEELKYYGLGAQMIKHHDINNIIILSNSNYKGIDISIYGINVTGVEVINNDK